MFKELTNASNLVDLKKAYKKLVMKYHPDHCGDDGTAFIELKKHSK